MSRWKECAQNVSYVSWKSSRCSARIDSNFKRGLCVERARCRADVAVAVNDGDEYARDAVFIFCARTHAAAAAAADDDDDVAAR